MINDVRIGGLTIESLVKEFLVREGMASALVRGMERRRGIVRRVLRVEEYMMAITMR